MSRIKILSDVVASQIAAGEVVQRPASVVKELVDNALDAGAGRISVEVEKGGTVSLRVTDDGCGIPAEDLPLALKRHATSKIELESDLRSIQTHGFRGEALAAISSVSKIEIVSRLPSERQGNRMTAEGGENLRVEPCGCPPGTSVSVSDLFYNTPARRKFMKSATTEMERIGAILLRAALSNPSLHFELSHNGKLSRRYAAVPSAVDRIVQIFGEELIDELLPVDYAGGGVQIEGFCSRPTTHRKTAGDLYFFVNGRFIRDKILLRALIEAYRASLPQRRYPVAVLFLSLPSEEVDVNVHPTKEEIRFSDEGKVWRTMYASLREALGGGARALPQVTEKEEFQTAAAVSAKENAQSGGSSSARISHPESLEPVASPSKLLSEPARRAFVDRLSPEQEEDRRRVEEIFASQPDAPVERMETLNRRPLLEDKPVSSSDPPEPAKSWRVVAQLFDSFILCEGGEEMALFDQHALHERIQFEKLRKQYEEGRIGQQSLMFPLTVEVAPNQTELLQESTELLAELGLDIDHFGDRTFIVRSVPADLDFSEIEGLVQDALHDLSDQGLVTPLSETAEKILARMSCRSAIKANEALERHQMQHLIDQYTSNPILSTCPHGRPPVWKLSRREIEKLFDRP
jgi:DNA mismatch repair protein MutL